MGIALVLLTSLFTTLGIAAFLYFGSPLGKLFGIVLLADRNFFRDTDQKALYDGAFEGAIMALGDPYSVYMDKEEWQSFLIKTSGEYSGIGVTMDTMGDRLRIALPIKGSPAEKAGLQADDIILGVDGSPVVTADEAAASIRGPKGTEVNLTVQRGKEIFDVTITREEILIPAVSYEIMDDNVGYLQLASFNEHSFEETLSALNALKEQGAKAILLDLRYNGGGYLNQCLAIAELFVPEGPVVSLRYRTGAPELFVSEGEGLGMPLLVLVNQGTASASEILAGAIQDRGVGTLVGDKTFGKGLVQGSFPLRDGSFVKLTTAEYLTPEGRAINQEGLTPEYLLGGDEEQMEKALDLASSMILEGQG